MAPTDDSEENADLTRVLDAVLPRVPPRVVGVVLTFVYDDGLIAQKCAATDEALARRLDELVGAISTVGTLPGPPPRGTKVH